VGLKWGEGAGDAPRLRLETHSEVCACEFVDTTDSRGELCVKQ
jgi:hypothetical protein